MTYSTFKNGSTSGADAQLDYRGPGVDGSGVRFDYDVIVVGAGPAGTAAAYRLVSDGLRVLLLDRHEFPREKPCAGGLTLKTLALMPYSVGSVIEHVTTGLDIGISTKAGTDIRRFDRGNDICAFAVRAKFDAFNLKKTIEKGAVFKVVRSIKSIAQAQGPGQGPSRGQAQGQGQGPERDHGQGQDFVALDCDGQVIRAKYLIGADGANSRVRRLVMKNGDTTRAAAGAAGERKSVVKNTGFYRGFALEGIVPFSKLETRPYAEFLLGVADNGYGWVFPKGDHANVGVFTNDVDTTLSKAMLRDYAQARLGVDDVAHITGFPLGFGGENFWQVAGRVVLVGDAGGFAEPLLGEGLHNAVKSGQAAGQAIVDIEMGQSGGSLGDRFEALSKPIRKDIKRCCDIAHRVLYPRLGGLGGRMLMHPLSRYALLKGFAAGETVRGLTNGAVVAGMKRPKKLAALGEFHELDR